jgi:ribonuclease HI
VEPFNFENMDPSLKTSRWVEDLLVNKICSRGFFDGACQGLEQLCGLGGVLYISDSHYFTLISNCCKGTNNLAKLMALKILLRRAFDCSLRDLQVFGESLLVVNRC